MTNGSVGRHVSSGSGSGPAPARWSRGARHTVAVAGVLLLAGCGVAASSNVPQLSSGTQWAGAELLHPLHRPSFTLTDDAGQPYDFAAQTRGKLTLLYFGYTHCPDICPLNMADTAAALGDLPAGVRARITVVFVTTDPARDTPAVLRAWLARYDPAFIGLTGSPAEIELAQIAANVPPSAIEATGKGSYVVDHAGYVIAYTRDNLAHMTYPAGVEPSAEAKDLSRLVTGWKD